MLLIVTNKSDLASDYLILRLKERNISFERLNTEDYSNYEIDIFLEATDSSFELRLRGRPPFGPKSLSAAYFRQALEPELASFVDPEDLAFAQRETLEMLRSLWRLIDRDRWLNHPTSILAAGNKVDQLRRAASLGFSIPPTCVSRNPSTIRRFCELHDRDVIVKAVKHGFLRSVASARVITTQMLDNMMLDQLETFAPLPCIFQRRLEKLYDIRITVAGRHVYATAIHSQEHDETRVDWRECDLQDLQLRHEPITLPPMVTDRCRELTHQFGLKYSAIDMVLTRSGEFVFLEMNPNGQWAWIEEAAGYPIRDALIETMGL